MSSNARDWIAATRTAYDRLVELGRDLDQAGLEAQSYDSDWSIGQVYSHLGSQAEIMNLFLDAARDGAPAPSNELFPGIWDRWNAKAPLDWRDDSLDVNGGHLARLESLTQEQLDTLSIPMFGGQWDVVGFMRLRLGEIAVHTWDVAVALDPAATVSADAIDLLIDNLTIVATRSGKGSDTPYAVRVTTTEPTREFTVVVGEGVTLADADTAHDGTLSLPAEAFVRLAYGRLDPDHAPVVETTGSASLVKLRAAFPGF